MFFRLVLFPPEFYLEQLQELVYREHREQQELFLKSYEAILHQYSAARALDELQRMLEFQEFLEQLKQTPESMKQPIERIDAGPIKRTLMEWAKEKLGLTDASVEHNRRVLETYVQSFEPLTEEIHELRKQQERDVHELFNPRMHFWT